ncbi:MAG: nitronate monooxygenase [Gammaproteobacteria bacterium]|nr:nitronate monooxygenase [Gammaproteobacteria bacterium]
MWPQTTLLELFGTQLPIIQAPMAGANDSAMTIAVSQAGGLGSLPGAMLDQASLKRELSSITQATSKPFNVNFFCHQEPDLNPAAHKIWHAQLQSLFDEFGVSPPPPPTTSSRLPFDTASCAIVEKFRPRVVSFHFGLPKPELVERVRSAGCKIISSATTVEEALWLQSHGCDAIIAQGYEAGGHRGMFLSQDINTQPGIMALLPQVVDAVKVPVIAAGGIADGRGIAAAFALGAAGVQLGTAYLLTPEATISQLHRTALLQCKDNQTALTNVFSGKPARCIMNRMMREIGPMSDKAPSFPTAGNALTPLRKKAQAMGSADFGSLWSGQAGSLCRTMGAGELTEQLATEALHRLAVLSNNA